MHGEENKKQDYSKQIRGKLLLGVENNNYCIITSIFYPVQ